MKKDQKYNYRRHLKYAGYKSLMLIIGCLILSSLNGCKKLIEINPNGSAILQSSVFTDSLTVQSAIAGMYVTGLAPQSSPYRFSLSTIPGFTADEMQYVGTANDTYINNNILSSDAGTFGPGNIWSQSYSAIYNANALIAGVTGNSAISVRFQNQAIAEARFIRAFAYFYLVNSFGDVPLVLNTDPNANTSLPRTSVAAVYTQIVADLKFAQATLPADYTTISAGARTRINKWIATAMLARVYLYQSNWTDAEAQATLVISNSLFSLPTDLTKVFTPTSTEAIWQLYNDANGYTFYAANIFSQTSKVPTYILNPLLVNSFEAGDARKTAWTSTVAYSGTTYSYPSKYKNITTGANAEYYTVLRLAEQILIRAEARLMLGNTSGAQADINLIRRRAGLAAITVTSTTGLMAAIMQERKIEFNCEWGHRWYDLKRTGTVNAVLSAAKPTFWKTTAALYPIPLAEITLDPNITQNPGYN